jgi:hypothetical protein
VVEWLLRAEEVLLPPTALPSESVSTEIDARFRSRGLDTGRPVSVLVSHPLLSVASWRGLFLEAGEPTSIELVEL